MIYAVERESRIIYETQPMGDFIMIRPAQKGQEQLIERVDFTQFARMFDPFMAKFLIPNELRDDDFLEESY